MLLCYCTVFFHLLIYKPPVELIRNSCKIYLRESYVSHIHIVVLKREIMLGASFVKVFVCILLFGIFFPLYPTILASNAHDLCNGSVIVCFFCSIIRSKSKSDFFLIEIYFLLYYLKYLRKTFGGPTLYQCCNTYFRFHDQCMFVFSKEFV